MTDIKTTSGKKVLLASPRGYCAGVDRAVIAVEKALDHYGAPVYVRKQIVHNKHVVSSLEKRGAIFVDEVDEVPTGSVLVFSAHGVSPAVVAAAESRGLNTIDATCPLVTKVHKEVQRFAKEGYDILLVGHEGHEEVEGTAGEAPDVVQVVDGDESIAASSVKDPSKVIWLSQTTLSVDETSEIIAVLRQIAPLAERTDREDRFFGTRVRVMPELKGDTEWLGTIQMTLNGGRLFSVKRDGSDAGSIRISGDRLEILSIADADAKPKEPTKAPASINLPGRQTARRAPCSRPGASGRPRWLRGTTGACACRSCESRTWSS